MDLGLCMFATDYSIWTDALVRLARAFHLDLLPDLEVLEGQGGVVLPDDPCGCVRDDLSARDHEAARREVDRLDGALQLRLVVLVVFVTFERRLRAGGSHGDREGLARREADGEARVEARALEVQLHRARR